MSGTPKYTTQPTKMPDSNSGVKGMKVEIYSFLSSHLAGSNEELAPADKILLDPEIRKILMYKEPTLMPQRIES